MDDPIFIDRINVFGVEDTAQIKAERGEPMITSNLATLRNCPRSKD